MKGYTFTAIGPFSSETIAKLDKMVEDRDRRIAKMIEDYRTGKLTIPMRP